MVAAHAGRPIFHEAERHRRRPENRDGAAVVDEEKEEEDEEAWWVGIGSGISVSAFLSGPPRRRGRPWEIRLAVEAATAVWRAIEAEQVFPAAEWEAAG